ncbi:neurogenic locus notch homolog protein 3-like isoform X2 [Hydractinia symbiolongicarpus]|uniref:neurogenic locus notch homolog protein 3-like isoform X2 n=1 Tax=Hydractinia symbiolongicarpus TaxID=13093 RepID=UPI00254F896A|nr:neurogenic locus notch homolog protein 3-like isoform X2 [Hydractinia symbiolongicarpus]
MKYTILLFLFLLIINLSLVCSRRHHRRKHLKEHHLRKKNHRKSHKRHRHLYRKYFQRPGGDEDGEYNITKTYDTVSRYNSQRPDYRPGYKRHFEHMRHNEDLLHVPNAGEENGEFGNMFMSTEPIGTPLGRVNAVPTDHGGIGLVGAMPNIQNFGLMNNEGETEIPVGPLHSLQSLHSLHSMPMMDDMHHSLPPQDIESHHMHIHHDQPEHLYEHGIEKTEEGVEHGGFLSPEPLNMKLPGVHHIHKPPIHVQDPHSTTSYETTVEHGAIHNHVCQNGGLYFTMKDNSDYQCICPESNYGKNCELKDYCNPCPCKNKGDCHNIKEEPFYKCSCKRGFLGSNCEKNDPCFPNPCKNHGVCTHDGTTATCICALKFRGPKCAELNNCSPNPCKNSGTCIQESGEGRFSCECLTPFRGTICEKHSYCHMNPCMNGGICREAETKFECTCANGFSGPTCQDRVCLPNPCMNGGSCIEDGDKFKCVCLPWTSGSMCEESRPCLTKPCMHEGKCIDAYSGFHWSFGPMQYYCICKPPYNGMNCEQHACKNCHKNAHCQVDHCVCDEGYEGNGENCKKVDNPCHPNPCFNNGVCSEVADYCSGSACGFKCSCPAPFVPPLCKEKNPCDPDPCQNGECVVRGDSTFHCNCEYGFRGHLCQEKDGCNPNPCQHRGTCTSHNGTASCSCVGKWQGPFCKECGCPEKNIKGIPSLTCSQEGTCICPQGYTVDMRNGLCKRIEPEAISPCAVNPCSNGGTCIDITSTEYKCICPPGVTGKACQYRLVCNPGPCLNGGICKEKYGKFLGCDCPPGTIPPLCVKEGSSVNAVPGGGGGAGGGGGGGGSGGACTPNPCRHDGVCVANRGSYDCICPVRYTGPHCDVDRCGNCHKHAKCVNGHCKCEQGFIGNGYNCERDMCDMICVEWSTCVDGQCVCNPGYTKLHNQCVPHHYPKDD